MSKLSQDRVVTLLGTQCRVNSDNILFSSVTICLFCHLIHFSGRLEVRDMLDVDVLIITIS